MDTLPATAIDHVGIASVESATPLTRALGADPVAAIRMPSGVEVGRFGPGFGLELVTPGRASNPIEGFLAKRGPGLHHLALRVETPLPGLIEELAEAGIATTGSVEPSADGRPSVFLHPRGTGGVLVELVEGSPR